MNSRQDSGSPRASFLPVLLVGMAAFFFVLILILLTGGFVFWIVLCAGCATGMASLHWLVWGKLLTQLTAGEREEVQLLERARANQEPERIKYRR